MFGLAAWGASRLAFLAIGAYGFLLDGQPVPWLPMWIQWDAGFYLSIAEHGYMPPQAITGHENGQSNVNFFPLLPVGIALFSHVFPPASFAGVIFANVCLIVSVVLLHRLASLRSGDAAADWSAISLMALPGSFALSSPLSESTFLAFSIAAAYANRRGRDVAAVASAAVLTVARLTGIALGAGLALDWLIARLRGGTAPYRTLMLFSFIPLPLVLFSAYMFHLTGDALAPLHSNFAFWDQRLGVPFQSLAMFLWTNQPRLQIQSVVASVMLVVLLSQARLFSAGELLFVIASVASFASSESASPSLIRYTLALYPLHLAMGRLCHRHRGMRLLLLGLAFINGALAIYWFHGRDIYV